MGCEYVCCRPVRISPVVMHAVMFPEHVDVLEIKRWEPIEEYQNFKVCCEALKICMAGRFGSIKTQRKFENWYVGILYLEENVLGALCHIPGNNFGNVNMTEGELACSGKAYIYEGTGFYLGE